MPESIDEMVKIQEFKAEQVGVKLLTEYYGFEHNHTNRQEQDDEDELEYNQRSRDTSEIGDKSKDHSKSVYKPLNEKSMSYKTSSVEN